MRFKQVWRGSDWARGESVAQLVVDEIGCRLGAVRGGGEWQRGGVNGETRWRDAGVVHVKGVQRGWLVWRVTRGRACSSDILQCACGRHLRVCAAQRW